MSLSVLIVDDEAVFRNYIRSMDIWSEGDYTLIGEAQNSDEALELMHQFPVDIVIFDVSMPGKNGVVLSKIISENHPETSMVAISSYDDYDYVRQILINGAEDYILKSRISPTTLKRTLDNIREGKEKKSPWELKTSARMQTKEWLLQNKESPFTRGSVRKLAVVLDVIFASDILLSEQATIIEGISKNLEGHSNEKADILAVPMDDTHIVAIYRFYNESSDNKMKEAATWDMIDLAVTTRKAYNIDVRYEVCPVFVSDQATKSYILYKLGTGKKNINTRPVQRLFTFALTIKQQNCLLQAIDRLDAEQAQTVVEEIYNETDKNDNAKIIMITRELLEMLNKLTAENDICLDFIPSGDRLAQYTLEKPLNILIANISGLYLNLFREIRQRKREVYSELVQKAIIVINGNYSRTLSLSDIAEQIGTNSSYLSRIFHKETKMTCIEYINTVRIEHAKTLLSQQLPIKEVARSCGYRDYGYFLETFKRIVGITPGEFLLKNAK